MTHRGTATEPPPVPLLDLRPQFEGLRTELESALARVLDSQAFVLGPEVEAFEASIAEYVGVRHAIGVASGTDAVLLSVRALELEPGDEVVVPAFTFFATAGARHLQHHRRDRRGGLDRSNPSRGAGRSLRPIGAHSGGGVGGPSARWRRGGGCGPIPGRVAGHGGG